MSGATPAGHTPPVWRAEHVGPDEWHVISPLDGRPLAKVYGPNAEQDALLIAGAPLLANAATIALHHVHQSTTYQHFGLLESALVHALTEAGRPLPLCMTETPTAVPPRRASGVRDGA